MTESNINYIFALMDEEKAKEQAKGKGARQRTRKLGRAFLSRSIYLVLFFYTFEYALALAICEVLSFKIQASS